MCQAGCRCWGFKGKQVPALKEFNSQPMPFIVPVHTLYVGRARTPFLTWRWPLWWLGLRLPQEGVRRGMGLGTSACIFCFGSESLTMFLFFLITNYSRTDTACAFSHVQLFVIPWTVAHEAPLSMEWTEGNSTVSPQTSSPWKTQSNIFGKFYK